MATSRFQIGESVQVLPNPVGVPTGMPVRVVGSPRAGIYVVQEYTTGTWIIPELYLASVVTAQSYGSASMGTIGSPLSSLPSLPSMYPSPVQAPTSGRRKFKDGETVEITGNSQPSHHLRVGAVCRVVGFENGWYKVTPQSTDAWVDISPEQSYQYIGVKDITLYIPKPKVTLSSVVISEQKKEEIMAAISQVQTEDVIFTEWGFSDVFEKGTAISLLFWGIPGTGKTLTAQAIADEVNGELKIYSTAEIQSSEPGGAERTIKQIFSEANRINKNKDGKKRVILFDECDSLLMDRNEVGPILGAMVNTLLTELEHYDGIIIFTTNRMGKLDPALERRLSGKIEFEFPDRAARLSIWQRMIPKRAPIAKNVSLKKLADYPLAGGNIKNAVLNAARIAAYKKDKEIKMEYFIDAIEREAKALQAFISEYEKQSHSSMLGHIKHDSTGSVVVDKQAIKETIDEQISIHSTVKPGRKK